MYMLEFGTPITTQKLALDHSTLSQSQTSLLLKWSHGRIAQVQKDRLSRRNSIAVTTNTIRKSEEVFSGGEGKKPVAKNTTSVPPASRSFKRQRSVSCSPCSPEDLAAIRASRKLSKN